MMSRSSTITESAGNRPFDFSSTYLAISELAKPKLASRANSVSATGVSLPASSPVPRMKCTPPIVTRPASGNAGTITTPSVSSPLTAATVAAMTSGSSG